MALAAASATVGRPVDSADLTDGSRRILVAVALAVHRADTLAPASAD